jgi:chitin disaccharide deacetylase
MLSTRRLIVNADDFGLSTGINQGVVKAHDDGIVTSASLMVHKPAATQAAALARARPRLSLGLHIDVGEWKYERGHCVAIYERVPQDDTPALNAAVTEQVELFRRLIGATPTHLDSHQHLHKWEPLQSIVRQLANRLGIPLRYFNPHVSYCCDFYGQDKEGHPLAGQLTSSSLMNIIKTLHNGVTELSCHPAASLDFQSSYYQERLEELDALCSPVLVDVLEREQVLLTSFSKLRY